MRVEVLSGVERRRQWSDDEKARIIEETWVPGARVAEVARRNAGEVQLYGDHLEDAEDDMYRVLNKFTQYNFQARVVIHYEGEDVSEGPSWSDDEQYY